jgi:DNA-binding transcriptional regulator YdaS (Cro superfamily)
MILLGLVLVLLAGGAIALVATEETSRYILFGQTFEFDHVGMFLVGAATAVVLLVGIALMSSGLRRSAKRRRQVRAARAESSNRVTRLEDEKRELQRKLEREHAQNSEPAKTSEPANMPSDRLVAGRHAEDATP